MDQDLLRPFIGKKVRVILDDGFRLFGVIDMVSEDAILFTSDQKTAFIRFKRITEVTPVNNWRRG